ncbi:MAG: hypothetical protein JWN70_5439 [Planctomycetaceae bacterium]|nr:hypothetical protein [Planctomycetaceae bacterium]
MPGRDLPSPTCSRLEPLNPVILQHLQPVRIARNAAGESV